MMKTRCPHCRRKYDIPDVYNDREIKCTKCNKAFKASKITLSKNKRKIILASVIITIAFVVTIAFVCLCFFQSSISLLTQEVSLGNYNSRSPLIISPDKKQIACGRNTIFSPNSRRTAYVAHRGEKSFVVVDGMGLKEYDRVSLLTFSPDSKRVAYIGLERPGLRYIVVDEKEEYKWYNMKSLARDLIFSPDSNHVACAIRVSSESEYRGRDRQKWKVIVDNVEGKEYDNVTTLVFFPATGEVVYGAKYSAYKSGLVIGTVEGKAYDDLGKGTPIISPDGKRIAYSAKVGKKWLVVLDGIEMDEYDAVFEPVFSPDGKRFAYLARSGKKWLVVADGVESEKYDGVSEPVFSPDSRRIAFAAMRDNKHYVIVDGIQETGYDSVGAIAFSADGERVAYAAKQSEKWFTVVDRVEQREYDALSNLTFSPNGERVAYVAHRGERSFVVLDGVEQREYDGANLLVFSPDSKRIAYCANVGCKNVTLEEDDYEIRNVPQTVGKDPLLGLPRIEHRETKFPNYKGMEKLNKAAGHILVVVDGDEGRKYHVTANLTFSPDSKHYTYWASNDRDWAIIVDGVKVKRYDSLLSSRDTHEPMDRNPEDEFRYYLAGRSLRYPNSEIVFDAPTRFHTLAKREEEIYRCEVEILDDN